MFKLTVCRTCYYLFYGRREATPLAPTMNIDDFIVSFRFYSIKKETKSSLLKTRQGVDYSFIMSRGWGLCLYKLKHLFYPFKAY